MKKFILLLLTGLSIYPLSAFTAEFKPLKEASEKAEKKKNAGWSLDEWLAQRDRSRMMDLWLAMNTSESSEYYLSIAQNSYTKKVDQPPGTANEDFSIYAGSLGAYSSIMGLNFDYQNNHKEEYTDLAGSLRIRVFGNADQASNLTFGFGQRTLSTAVGTYKFLFPEAQLSLHLMKRFGITANYQQFQPISDTTLGDMSGSKTSYGLFIDFGVLRLFGTLNNEILITHPGGVLTTTSRGGVLTGLKLYF